MNSDRAVFFDRDGTLMKEVHYCRDPATVVAVDGAAAALKKLREAHWKTIIVTNQSGLASGRITPDEYEAVARELNRQLDNLIDATYFCADAPHAATPCRKPGTGMLETAAREQGINLGSSWMVGDKDSDIVCGRAAGCRTILVLTGYGTEHRDCGADHTVRDVTGAVEIILSSPQ
jgi:D-glycero-D-manno-heptose 1,7-bisphosphate phosphatase